MDLRDLTAFAAIARHQSFSRAAVQLRVAQSALSRRVQRLEHVLGVALFDRHVRGVRLTEAGSLLVEKVDKLVGEIEEIEAAMKRLGRPAAEELRFAIPHGATKLFGSAYIEQYRRRRAQTRLVIVEQSSAPNRHSVLKGEVDAALAYEPEESSELCIQPLLSERLVVVGPARCSKTGQAIAYPARYQAADLARLPLLLPSSPHGYRRLVERIVRPLRVEPNVVLEVEGLPALATLVEDGLGVMVSTPAAVCGPVAAGTLVAVPIASPRCTVELCLIHRRDREASPALQVLKEVIAEASLGLAADGKCRAVRA